MSYDKIVDSSALDASLTAVADAIRAKTGKAAAMTLAGMPAEIGGISDATAIIDGSVVDLADERAESVAKCLFWSGNQAYWNRTLKTVKLPKVATVGDMAFYACLVLESVELPSATAIGANAFYNCTKLAELSIPKAVTIAGSAFRSCPITTDIDLPDATSIGTYAFYGGAFDTVNLPKATTIGSYAFANCLSLNTVDLGAATSIGANAFNKCSSLFDLYLRSPTVCSLANTNAFTGTPSSLFIHVPAELVDSYKTATNWSTYADQIDAI